MVVVEETIPFPCCRSITLSTTRRIVNIICFRVFNGFSSNATYRPIFDGMPFGARGRTPINSYNNFDRSLPNLLCLIFTVMNTLEEEEEEKIPKVRIGLVVVVVVAAVHTTQVTEVEVEVEEEAVVVVVVVLV